MNSKVILLIAGLCFFVQCSETPELCNNYSNCSDLHNSVFNSEYHQIRKYWGEPDQTVVSEDKDFITCTWSEDKVHVTGSNGSIIVTFKSYLLQGGLGYTPAGNPIKCNCGGMELEAK